MAATQPRLRVLVLDCGGITNPDCEAGMADVAAAMGVNEEDATLGHKAAWSLARSDPTFTEYWDHAFKVAGVPPDARTKERQEACEAALGAALRVSYPDSLEAASWARSQGVVVGVISNHLVAPPLFDYCSEGAGLAALVSDPSLLVVSQAVGLGKPDPAIYELFFERLLKLHPEAKSADLCFVDDKEKNCAAALALGWRAIHHDARKVGPGELRKRIVQELELGEA